MYQSPPSTHSSRLISAIVGADPKREFFIVGLILKRAKLKIVGIHRLAMRIWTDNFRVDTA